MTEIQSTDVAAKAVQISSLIEHMRNPQNLLTYMVFTAWCKFMGISQYVPQITIG